MARTLKAKKSERKSLSAPGQIPRPQVSWEQWFVWLLGGELPTICIIMKACSKFWQRKEKANLKLCLRLSLQHALSVFLKFLQILLLIWCMMWAESSVKFASSRVSFNHVNQLYARIWSCECLITSFPLILTWKLSAHFQHEAAMRACFPYLSFVINHILRDRRLCVSKVSQIHWGELECSCGEMLLRSLPGFIFTRHLFWGIPKFGDFSHEVLEPEECFPIFRTICYEPSFNSCRISRSGFYCAAQIMLIREGERAFKLSDGREDFWLSDHFHVEKLFAFFSFMLHNAEKVRFGFITCLNGGCCGLSEKSCFFLLWSSTTCVRETLTRFSVDVFIRDK